MTPSFDSLVTNSRSLHVHTGPTQFYKFDIFYLVNTLSFICRVNKALLKGTVVYDAGDNRHLAVKILTYHKVVAIKLIERLQISSWTGKVSLRIGRK